MTGAEVRHLARMGDLMRPTAGLAPGFVQANLACVPRELAFDFLLFCLRNPKPCPLLDVCDPGDPEPRGIAPGADVRTDCPLYRVYQNGELVAEPTELGRWWREDIVSFLLGCSFTFETALLKAGLPLRHIEMGRNVPMYRTNVPCRSSGPFAGPMVVSMRPLTPEQAKEAGQICRNFPLAHGEPVWAGDPTRLGIADINKPDFGDAVEIRHGEVPVFWACGVTPQAVAMNARPPLLLTHSPGHMFVSDLRDSELVGRVGI
jgi:uncharacterized protein YcsI (UPF0317 family)